MNNFIEILKFQSPKNAIFSVLGAKFEDKTRACFSFKKMKLSIYQSHNQFLWAMNKMMKTKLHTFARKQIVRKPIRNFWKKWLKYSVHMTNT